MRVSTWLKEAITILSASDIPSPMLDAEIILAHTLHKPRTWIHAHGEDDIEPRATEIAQARLELRKERVPVAYIIGHKEFYGRRFYVTPSVLIPRPETEVTIAILNTFITRETHTLIDVGTGSGCIAITAKLEHPKLNVIATDISRHALVVAERNAEKLQANVTFYRADLLDTIKATADIITANLPYVDTSWECSPELRHEPSLALFSKDTGLHHIKRLIDQVGSHLSSEGIMLLEADTRQHAAIVTYATDHGFTPTRTEGLIVVLQRVATKE